MKAIQTLPRMIVLVFLPLLLGSCQRIPAEEKPKNIILLIGDGMGPQAVSMALTYARQAPHSVVPGRLLAIEKMMNHGVTGQMLTHPSNALVVDSACSATQLAAGVDSSSEMIGLDSMGNPVETILEKASRAGLSTGLVSDTRVTHATPAGFAAHVRHRSLENEIAAQMIESPADVLLSGGWRHFFPANPDASAFPKEIRDRLPKELSSKRKDSRNLILEARDKGFDTVFTRAQLLQSTSPRILGLFSESGMPDAIETRIHKTDPRREYPTLAEMTTKALSVLSQDNDGFFLMVEGGQIDWAEHANDAGTLVHQMLEFDDAIGVAMQFAQSHPDTLVVVTADHETGSPGFSYSRKNLPEAKRLPGKEFRNHVFRPNYNFIDPSVLDKIYAQKKSFERIFHEFANLSQERQTPATLMKLVNESLSFPITEDQAERILETEPNLYRVENHPRLDVDEFPRIDDFEEFYVYGEEGRTAILARLIAADQGVVWATGTHTATPVYVIAAGPSAYRFSGVHHSSEVGSLLQKLLQLP